MFLKKFLFAITFISIAIAISIAGYSHFSKPKSALAAGNIINAASCEQADVQTAINQAVDGDTVLVPAGSCTITAQMIVANKNITVKGAGIDTTTFTANIVSGIRPGVFKVITKPAKITGFTFNGTAPTYGAHLVFESTGDETALFRADHNKFTVDSGYSILTWGLSYGVIDSNAFATTMDHSFIDIYSDNRASWGKGSSLGTAKAVYIENNTFTNSANSGNNRSVTTDGGARFVFRNNTVTNQALDAHGYCGNGLAGTMSFEIYNNIWLVTSGTNIFRWMFLRGGSGVVYNNIMTNNGTIYREIDITEYRLSGINSCISVAKTCCTSYPCLDQIGRSADQSLDPVYFWDNTINETDASITVNQVDDGTCAPIPNISDFIQLNRDYYVGSTKPNYTPYAYPHPLISATSRKGDFNLDDKVNNLDFTSFKNAFKSIFNSIFDLNSDNAIDVKDLGVLMSSWLP